MRARIERAGGDPDRVTVVAVTKTFGPDAVDAALQAGVSDIGENYASELARKAEAFAGLEPSQQDSLAARTETGRRPRWHFLGAIQRNKVAKLVPIVSCWQSVSREAEAETIASRAAARDFPMPSVFVEVNLTGDTLRGGCAPEQVPAVVQAASSLGLQVRGLMAVAPHGGPDEAASGFRRVARLADELGLRELSMGMSGDLEEAVRAGSTMVRIGTGLFGSRITRAPGAGL